MTMGLGNCLGAYLGWVVLVTVGVNGNGGNSGQGQVLTSLFRVATECPPWPRDGSVVSWLVTHPPPTADMGGRLWRTEGLAGWPAPGQLCFAGSAAAGQLSVFSAVRWQCDGRAVVSQPCSLAKPRECSFASAALLRTHPAQWGPELEGSGGRLS